MSGRFVGPILSDKPVKFGDPRFNLSREIPPETVRGGIFDGFLSGYLPEVVSAVISGIIIDPTCLKDPVKFGNSRSNRSRDIRLPHFVTNEDDTGVRWSSHKDKTPYGVLPKKYVTF